MDRRTLRPARSVTHAGLSGVGALSQGLSGANAGPESGAAPSVSDTPRLFSSSPIMLNRVKPETRPDRETISIWSAISCGSQLALSSPSGLMRVR